MMGEAADEGYGPDAFAAAIEEKIAAARDGEQEQPRDNKGQFAAAPTDETEPETPADDSTQKAPDAPAAAEEQPPAAEEEPAEEPAETPEPDDEQKGAQAAAEEALAALPDDATDEERQTAAREAASDFYAGRYKTREEAERGISEKDTTITRLHQERADQARRIAELEQQTEQASKDEPIDVPAWTAWADTMVEAGQASGAAMKALEEGGYQGYRVVLDRWMNAQDEDGNPDTAAISEAISFNNEVIMALAEERAKQAAAQERQQEQPVDSAAVARDAQEQLRAAYPDFDEYEERMADVVSTLDPARRAQLAAQAQSGPDGVAQALEYVYLRAKSSRVDTGARAQQVADERVQASADAAILAASVATTEATSSRTPASPADKVALDYRNARRVEWNLPPLEE